MDIPTKRLKIDQRLIHAGDAIIRRLFRDQRTVLVDVDEVSIDGPLRLPEYADHRVQ